MKTYDPKKFVIVFANIPINKGLADGTFCVVSSMKPGFSSKAGADGEVTRVRSQDRRATARITLMQTSDVNLRLSRLYNADRDAVNGQGVGMFYVQDLNGDTKLEADKAYIADDPDLTLSADAETREWVIELSELGGEHGGALDD